MDICGEPLFSYHKVLPLIFQAKSSRNKRKRKHAFEWILIRVSVPNQGFSLEERIFAGFLDSVHFSLKYHHTCLIIYCSIFIYLSCIKQQVYCTDRSMKEIQLQGNSRNVCGKDNLPWIYSLCGLFDFFWPLPMVSWEVNANHHYQSNRS